MLEVEGWVLSSTPVDVRDEGESVAIDRHRQAVSPAGELTEEVFTIAPGLGHPPPSSRPRRRDAGYRRCPARRVPATRDYVGSTVVMLEAPA